METRPAFGFSVALLSFLAALLAIHNGDKTGIIVESLTSSICLFISLKSLK